jgi:hypothetical protein
MEERLYYDIPPFALSFRTKTSLPNSLLDGELLARTLGEPLRLIVTEFLLDALEDQLAQHASDPELPEIVWQFRKLGLEVRVLCQAIGAWDQGYGTRHRQLDMKTELGDADYLEVYAEFVGSSEYVEAVDPTKPSNEVMYKLLGRWIDAGFTEDISILKQRLLDSEQELLQSHQLLSVETGIMAGSDPFFGASPQGMAHNDLSASHKAVISVFVVVCATATVMTALFLVRPCGSPEKFSGDGVFPQLDGDNDERTLPGRRREALEDTRGSILYPSEECPDLLKAAVKITPSQNDGRGLRNTEVLAPSVNSHSQELKYGTQESLRFPDININALSIVDVSVRGSSVGTWWNKLTSSFSGCLDLSEEDDGLVCEEDPNPYTYPFMDFPRHDGTPCLIYSEGGRVPSVIETRGTFSDSLHSESSSNPSESLTDYEFKRQRSLHSVELSHGVGFFEKSECDGANFVKKMERMIAMRHRHYEKENIMSRAREVRRKERMYTDEAKDRELKLRRHTNEHYLKQIEANLTPLALSRRSIQGAKNSSSGATRKKSYRVASDYSNFSSGTSNVIDSEDVSETFDETPTQFNGQCREREDAEFIIDVHDNHRPPMPRPTARKGVLVPRGDVLTTAPRIRKCHSVAEEEKLSGKSRETKHTHRRRRSFSHGMDQFNGREGQRNEHDVLTFGIAALADFV